MVVRRALALSLLLASFAVGVPAAQAAGTAGPDAPELITSAPYVSTASVDRINPPAETGAANAAVATSCNGGSPIYRSHWLRFTPASTTRVIARSHLFEHIGRAPVPLPNNIALVTPTGAILCAAGNGLVDSVPVTIPAGDSMSIVLFMTAGCDPQWNCYDATRAFALKPTDGVAPANDNWQTASPITSLPFSQNVDTTVATSQPEDPAGHYLDCASFGAGYAGTKRTVWWRYTPTSTGPVVLTLNGAVVQQGASVSDDGPRALLARLTPSGPDFDAHCEEGFPTLQAGVTYLIHVGSPVEDYYWDDHVRAGGPVTLSVAPVNPPAPAVTPAPVTTNPPPATPPAPVVTPPVVVPPVTAAPPVVLPPVTAASAPPRLNTTIRITRVQFNAPGRDTRANRNGEYVRVKNIGRTTVNLRGWTVRDAAGNRYTFRATNLAPGKSITVYTGSGKATSVSRFWDHPRHVWNNGGRESARLRDAWGRTVDSCTWNSGPRGYAATC